MVKRLETYSFTDFLAICGGLLGLFLGISLLSMIELIYIFTLRLFWIIQNARSVQPTVTEDEHRVTNSIAIIYYRKLLAIFKEFCYTSSIHGVQYFTKKRLHLSERLFRSKLFYEFLPYNLKLFHVRLWWLIAFGLSIWLCGSMIWNSWMEWKENPMIMSNNEKNIPISAIPFPTVTICDHIKIMKKKFDISVVYNKSYNLNESE